MKIMKTINRIPAGMMIVPLFIGILINTFCPQILQIGSFTTATFANAGAASFMGAQLIGIGSMLKIKELPVVVKRGGVLLVAKLAGGVIIGLLVNAIFGEGGFLGLTSLALISGITNSNGSMYTALMTTYGDSQDCAAVGMLTINDGPFLTLVAMGASGLANIPFMSIVAVIVPLIVGMILGNLDDDFTKFFQPVVGMMVPFVGITLGGSINLMNLVKGGLGGIVLGALAVFVVGPLIIFSDRHISKRSGYAGVAVSTVAGNAIATPAAIALADPSWEPFVATATTQIAAAVVFTALVIPFITSWWVNKYGAPKHPVNGHCGEFVPFSKMNA